MKQYKILIELTTGIEEEFTITGSEQKLHTFLSEYKQTKPLKTWKLLEESPVESKQLLFG